MRLYPLKFHTTDKYLRARIHNPKKYDKMRTIKLKDNPRILAIIGYNM